MNNEKIEKAASEIEFGLLNPTDKVSIITCLDFIAERFDEPLSITEIGINEGKTSLGIKRTLELWGKTLQQITQVDITYDIIAKWISREEYKNKLPEVNQIQGDSLEVYSSVPDNQHLIFIDGCHCLTHCICDFVNFFPKVKKGGLILMHDANPTISSTSRKNSYQGHGDSDNLDYGISSRIALDKLSLLGLNHTFKLFLDRYDPNDWIAGVVAFEKLV